MSIDLDILRGRGKAVLLWLLVLPLLYVVHLFNHTLSHDIAEIFSVIVACAIFMFIWNARPFLDNHYYLFIGIAFLAVGVLDFIHAMSYEGMFFKDEENLPAQLWYAARYVQSVSLLVAPWFAGRKLRVEVTFWAYAAITALLAGTILAGDIFPAAYVEGTGVTKFKIFSDYAVSAILLASAATLYRKRKHFEKSVLTILLGSILFSVVSELSFHLYKDAYSYNNLIGHYFKIVSFFLFYKAVVAVGLFRPYELLFRDLKNSEESLREARDGLEVRVAERTSDLVRVNERLEEELDRRGRMERERELIIDLLRIINSSGGVRCVLRELAGILRSWTGSEAVGIRLRSGFDFPYVETIGFSEEFVLEESPLAATDSSGEALQDEGGNPVYVCLCGEVLCGGVVFPRPNFTSRGSFWTNDMNDWFAQTRHGGRPAILRGRCLLEGYRSVAQVPLRIGEETFGLMQFNDRREGLFGSETVALLERVADSIASALGRVLAEEALRESEDRFRSLVDNSLVGILIVQEGRVVFRNPEQETILGPIPEGFEFRTFDRVYPDDIPTFERICDSMGSGSGSREDVDLRFAVEGDSGEREIRWVHCKTSPIEYQGRDATLVNMADITRIKDLEHVVVSREKLASLGHLSAGIAHEIRNPLSGINLNISTLEHLLGQADRMTPEERERAAAVIGQARSASNKIASVIRSVMEFSRPVPPRLGTVNMNKVIERAVEFSSAGLRRRGVELTTSFDSDLPDCPADPRLLEQVIVNLITNAAQAMEDVEGQKRIRMSSSREGDVIVIRVSDSGPGIPLHLREKIFDPFYTTRKDGYGIGLSFSNRVVSEHGGRLTVAESGWGGAEFRIELPVEARNTAA